MDDKDWLMMKHLRSSRSITQAAAVLFISQPAVSKRIQTLEEEVGAQLIARSSTGIQLTPAGRIFADYAEEMLERLRTVKNEIAENAALSELLRIGVPRTFSQKQMPEILRNFAVRCPTVRTDTVSGFSIDLAKMLMNQEMQIAFIRGECNLPGYDQYLVSLDYLCMISRYETDVAKMPDLQRVLYKTDRLLTKIFDDWWRMRFGQQKPRSNIEVGDVQSCIQMVREGAGYAIVPSYVLDNAVLPYVLVTPLRDEHDEIIHRKTSLFYPKGKLSAAESCFVELVREMFPEEKRKSG